MERFIAKSPSSKQILKSAKLSVDLPVNILITGDIGVGKKLLAKEILPNSIGLYADELEKLIISKQIDLKEYDSLILYDLEKVINLEQFLNNLAGIKLVSTSLDKHQKFNSKFAIKIEIPPLSDRKEDMQELIATYITEAKQIYGINDDMNPDEIKIDLTKNGISLKQSIHKAVLIGSFAKQDILEILEIYLQGALKQNHTYKELLEIFEIPLLKASKKVFKSQLKISKQLAINRITLRKKIYQYFGDK